MSIDYFSFYTGVKNDYTTLYYPIKLGENYKVKHTSDSRIFESNGTGLLKSNGSTNETNRRYNTNGDFSFTIKKANNTNEKIKYPIHRGY